VKGRQSPFLVPTFEPDLVLYEDSGSGDNTLTVVPNGYTDHMGDNRYRNYVGFFRDGTLLIREVTDITKNDPDIAGVVAETLTLDTTVGAAYLAGEEVCWVDKCRFANDDIELEWQSRDYLEFDAGLVRLP